MTDVLQVLSELAFWIGVLVLVGLCLWFGVRLAQALANAVLERRGRDGW
jgi:hypothetical protein